MQTSSGDDAFAAALGTVSRLGTSRDRERLGPVSKVDGGAIWSACRCPDMSEVSGR